ncbi:DUF1345 domain-containing protein [Sphingomonas sp. ASV193]|uniref:DUF1345 domain-containing protein n=1 Tax=Sphingomonas sp. ASV193 TaxID=3144405 RepID=UPI0032E90222
MSKSSAKGNRLAPWRFLLFFAVFGVGIVATLSLDGWAKGLLIAFDIAALVFLATCLPSLRYDAAKMREVAAANDANRLLLLLISILLNLVILAAIFSELGQQTKLGPWDKALVAASLVMVWLFANMVFTLHYAHLFYTRDDGGKDCAGLDFPGTKEPLFADFIYFAYTLGVAVQTSDVQIPSRQIRNVVTIQCVAGFFFNLGVLALTINVLGSGSGG